MGIRTLDRLPDLLTVVGIGLFLFALTYHVREAQALGSVVGPLLAFLLDGVPALGLAYAGYWLPRSDLSPESRRTVLIWSLVGAFLVGVVMLMTFLVLYIEARPFPEPVFPLLIAIEGGAIGGFLAGYYHARLSEEANRTRTVNAAMAFVNDLLRHDLRNDLQLIHGYSELGADDETQPIDDSEAAIIAEKAEEALDRIETSRAITNTLIGDPDFESVDVAKIGAEIAAQLETTADVEVTTDLPDSAVVLANEGLRSVIDNLLENAIEHSDRDDPEVTLAVTPTPDSVEISISNRGTGIPDQVKRAMYQSHEMGEEHGLSLVQSLVEKYQGSIRIEDDGDGTTVTVELPKADAGAHG